MNGRLFLLDDLHRAALGVRQWLRARMALVLNPPPVIAPKATVFQPALAGIKESRSPASRKKSEGK